MIFILYIAQFSIQLNYIFSVALQRLVKDNKDIKKE